MVKKLKPNKAPYIKYLSEYGENITHFVYTQFRCKVCYIAKTKIVYYQFNHIYKIVLVEIHK